MNLKFYLEKLESSSSFKNFIKQNPDVFICSCFFVIDKEGNDNKQHIDYFIPEKKEIYSFQLENDCQRIPLENINKEEHSFSKINFDYEIDFEEIESIIFNEMQKRGIKNKIQKLILSIQKINDVDFVICTIFISGMGIIKANINIAKKEITEFEKKSFFNMINIFGKRNSEKEKNKED